MSRDRLLQLAIPLVRTHGFTREALSRSVLALPPSEVHTEPLSETSVSALFGQGDLSRRNLINAWLDDGIRRLRMQTVRPTVKEALRARLELNEPVLHHLPEAFALLAFSKSGLPAVDPWPAVQHAVKIADEVCHITGDTSLQLAWYARRASLAAIYTAAELHQLTSPSTAYLFLDSLLDSSSSLESMLNDVDVYSDYVVKSWGGIFKSSGIF